MHLSRFTTLCPSIFWFAHPLFLTSLRQCFRSTLFDPNTTFIRPVLLYLPVHHALSHSFVSHPLLVPFPFFPSDICYPSNGDRTKWYRTKWHGQNGTDKMVYGQNGMGQNGMDKMVWTKWYGQNGS